MEIYAYAIHEALWDLDSIPGALIAVPHLPVTESCTTGNLPISQYCHHPVTNWSPYRRALRKLDRALQALQIAMSAQSNTSGALVANTCDLANKNPMQNDVDSGETHQSNDVCIDSVTPSDGSQHDGLSLTRPPNQDEFTVKDMKDPSLPEQLVLDLRVILARLTVPVRPQMDLAGIGELVVTILHRTFDALNGHDEHCDELIPSSDVIAMLHRLLDGSNETMPLPSPVNHSTDVLWSSRSIWLRALNAHFLRMEHQRMIDSGTRSDVPPSMEEIDDDGGHGGEAMEANNNPFFVLQPFRFAQEMHPTNVDVDSSPTLPSWVAVQFLPQFLETAIEMIHSTPWEPTDLGNVAIETCIQWRILTGYIIEHTIQMQQQDEMALQPKSNPDMNVVEQWLTECLREARSTESSEDLLERSQRLSSDLRLYVTELTEYALDALDGASVLFSSSKGKSGNSCDSFLACHYSARGSNELGIDAAAMQDASSALQDSLRHVALATSVLESVEPWYGKCLPSDTQYSQSQGDLISRLWRAVTESFIAKSNETTIFNIAPDQTFAQQVLHENNMASLLCYHQLRLADLFFASTSSSQSLIDPQNEFTLTLTFLRALDFPDQLIEARRLWKVIEQKVAEAKDNGALKKVLQVAVLTLRKQHNEYNGVSTSTPHQTNIQAIVERLLSILSPTKPDPQRNTNINATDSLFLRQLGSTPKGRMTD